MATVILPMGYPLQSGAEASLVVYQGTLVRSYTLPKDPRSAAQIQNRRFLSDFGKMRGTAGEYARARLRSGLGTTWGAILYQFAKGDLESCWTNALNEWSGFSEIERDEWRGVAPYEATFNDKGLIFFCLMRTVYKCLDTFSPSLFGCELWDGMSAADALTWHTEAMDNVFKKDPYPTFFLQSYGSFPGTITSNASASDGDYLEGISNFEFLIYGRLMTLFGKKASGLGSFDVYLDGNFVKHVDLHASNTAWQQNLVTATAVAFEDRNFNGLHLITISNVTGSCNIDYMRVS